MAEACTVVVPVLGTWLHRSKIGFAKTHVCEMTNSEALCTNGGRHSKRSSLRSPTQEAQSQPPAPWEAPDRPTGHKNRVALLEQAPSHHQLDCRNMGPSTHSMGSFLRGPCWGRSLTAAIRENPFVKTQSQVWVSLIKLVAAGSVTLPFHLFSVISPMGCVASESLKWMSPVAERLFALALRRIYPGCTGQKATRRGFSFCFVVN